jgi:hypothetical protein
MACRPANIHTILNGTDNDSAHRPVKEWNAQTKKSADANRGLEMSVSQGRPRKGSQPILGLKPHGGLPQLHLRRWAPAGYGASAMLSLPA